MITLQDLQGQYDITYQSSPQMPDWYESGVGSAQIINDTLIGKDGTGIEWKASFEIQADGTISFQAILDPTKAPPAAGLIDKNGQMTRQPQTYHGVLKATQLGDVFILRTTVIQGPITVNVQFKKVK